MNNIPACIIRIGCQQKNIWIHEVITIVRPDSLPYYSFNTFHSMSLNAFRTSVIPVFLTHLLCNLHQLVEQWFPQFMSGLNHFTPVEAATRVFNNWHLLWIHNHSRLNGLFFIGRCRAKKTARVFLALILKLQRHLSSSLVAVGLYPVALYCQLTERKRRLL